MLTDARILLVEPDEGQAVLQKGALEARNHNSVIRIRTTGNSALRILRREQFNMVVVEYGLQDMTGLEFLELLRVTHVDLPAIVMTSRPNDYIMTEAINLGAAEFVVKEPSYHLILPRLIEEALRRQVLIRKNRELEERLKGNECLEAVGLAVATMAHEINNPLSTIIGATELLSGDGSLKGRGARRKLKLIKLSANRIQESLARMSDLSEPSLRHTASGVLVDLKSTVSVTKTQG